MQPACRLLAALLLVLVSTSCGAPVVREGEMVRIGAVLPLSGSFAQEGQLAKEGYLFWQDWINARGGLEISGVRHRIRITIENDDSRPSVSGEVTERLIAQDGIRLLLGPYGNLATARDAAVADKHQVPIVAAHAAAESLFDARYRYLFAVVTPARKHLEGLIDMALTLTPRPQTAAILFANDSVSRDTALGARDYATEKGITVTYFASYPSGTNTLRSQLAEAAAVNPDMLLESGHVGESIVTIQEARELNLHPRLYGFTEGPGSERFARTLQRGADFIFGAIHWTALARTANGNFLSSSDYVSGYSAKYGHAPTVESAASTAACLAIAAALEKAGSLDPQRVRDSLAGLRLNSFFGELRFDERGANVYKRMYVEQNQSGNRVVVWPPEAASGHPRYPTPDWDQR